MTNIPYDNLNSWVSEINDIESCVNGFCAICNGTTRRRKNNGGMWSAIMSNTNLMTHEELFDTGLFMRPNEDYEWEYLRESGAVM